MSYDDLGAVGDQIFSIGDTGERWAEQNKGVTPIFFMEPIKNPGKSEKEGRPIFDEVERVRIIVAADQFNQIVHPVDDLIIERFPDHYRRWKENRTARHIDGTPIREWPLVGPAQVAEFEGMGIFNVEGLASVAETSVNRSQDLRAWRQKAQVWLASAKDNALAVRMSAENETLRAEMAKMREQMAALAAHVNSDDERRGPGRPRKDAA